MSDVNESLSVIGDLTTKLQTGAADSDISGLNVGSLLGSMSLTNIIVNILAGLIGTGFFMYGKKRENFRVLGFGVALCVVPYFISNTLLLIVACIVLAAAPFLMEYYA